MLGYPESIVTVIDVVMWRITLKHLIGSGLPDSPQDLLIPNAVATDDEHL